MPTREFKKSYKNMPKKIYIRTFGCQMDAFTQDDFETFSLN